MAERKSGPVKPPILDLTARPPERAAAKPTEASDATDPARPDPGMTKAPSGAGGPAETRTSRTPAPKPRGTFSPVARLVGVGLFGALAGGAIGLAGAWGLATLGLWPERPVSGADSSLADEMTALYVRKSDLGGILDRTLGPVTSELADVKAELAGVEARLSSDPTGELAGLGTRIDRLESGLADLAQRRDAAPAASDAGAASAIAALDGGLSALAERVAALEAQPAPAPQDLSGIEAGLAAARAEIGRLDAALAALDATPPPPPADLRLPLALSGLADALDSGAGFADELALIGAVLPDLAIPEAVVAAAPIGLGSPSALLDRFEALVPAILAAAPSDPRAGWGEQLLDRLKALVALRPVTAPEAATPEALVGAIETALGARDYAGAAAALARLPEPMRRAASTVEADIVRFAAASDFLAAARGAALALAGAAS